VRPGPTSANGSPARFVFLSTAGAKALREQGKTLLAVLDPTALRGKREGAMIAILLGRGVRRSERSSVTLKTNQ
jgi:hypothetical protein